MKPFDGNEYRKRVMTRLLDDFSLADAVTGDPFLVCDVEPDADTRSVATRIDDVVAFWQKDRNHPKYKKLAADLVARQDTYREVLLNPRARSVAAQRVRGSRAVSDEAARERFDVFAAMLLQAYGGVPRSRLAGLRAVAHDVGLPDARFEEWLAGTTVLDDEAAAAVPWDGAVRQQVRRALDELARGDATRAVRYRTLLTFLGVAATSSGGDLAAAHRRLAEANLSRARDAVMTLTEDLLTQVRTRLLVEGGMQAYLASLRADARDSVKDDLRRYALLTGRLPAAEVAALTARIVGLDWGLDTAQAHRAVEDAAHELHLSVEVGGQVDLVVCADCGRPQPADDGAACRYCGAALYLDCPSCGARIPAASQVCPRCGGQLAAFRAAEAAARTAQEALDAGRPTEAVRIATEALAGFDRRAAPGALRAVVDNAQAQLGRAGQLWRDAHAETGRGRWWSASAALRWLERNATDVPDPDAAGAPDAADASARSATDWLAELERSKAEVVAAVTAAAALPPEQADGALQRILRAHPDCPDAAGGLARLPLPAPGRLEVATEDGVARLSWQPAPGVPPSVRYVVERRVLFPADHAQTVKVATTSATHLDDGGAPAGTQVEYVVSTVDGNRLSLPVAASPVFVRRDLEALRAQVVAGRVELSWPTGGLGAAQVVLRREVDPGSGVTAPVRQIRPTEAGRYVDGDVQTSVPYRYVASLSYLEPDGTPVRTAGRSALVTVHAPPRAVSEMWASTDDQGRTTLTFVSPPTGMVRVYAAPGAAGPGGRLPAPLGAFAAGAVAELDAAARGVRLVGEGRRRVVDAAALGALVYQAVTVNGDLAVAGALFGFLAVPKPAGLRVVRDTGAEVTVMFELPPGVTEAFVRWRRDRFPTSATEPVGDAPGAGGTRVTNTKLDIDGGFAVPAPADGRGLFVAVFPAVRAGGGGVPVPATVSATLLAREPVTLHIDYTVRLGGLMRRKLEVDVRERSGRPLPPMQLVVAGDDPATAAQGRLLGTFPGGAPTAEVRLDTASVSQTWPVVLRLFATAPDGVPVEVADPALDSRRLQP